jgi:hypothetical protein
MRAAASIEKLTGTICPLVRAAPAGPVAKVRFSMSCGNRRPVLPEGR